MLSRQIQPRLPAPGFVCSARINTNLREETPISWGGAARRVSAARRAMGGPMRMSGGPAPPPHVLFGPSGRPLRPTGLKHLEALIVVFCYGGAAVVSILAAIVLIQL